MHNITSTAGIVAMGAGAVAIVALGFCVILSIRLRRYRSDQRIVLGEHGTQDLVSHSASLERQFDTLYDYVQDESDGLNGRLETVENRLDQAVSYRALVRYDAYGEMSGQRSTSIALLDSHHSGLILSSIHHRDQARVYAKEVNEGQPELELSPEEDEAVRRALESEARRERRA